MRKLLLTILFFLICSIANATNYFCTQALSQNWTSATWATSTGQATGSSGPPTAADTVTCDSTLGASATLTCNAATCLGLTLNTTGMAGTLAVNAGDTLTISGSVTLGSTGTLSGSSGSLVLNAAGTLTQNYASMVPWTLNAGGAVTTLGSNINFGGFLYGNQAASSLAGAFNVTFQYVNGMQRAGATVFKFTSGQTMTVTGGINLGGNAVAPCTWEGGTASSKFNLDYTGSPSGLVITNMNFQDVNANGLPLVDYCQTAAWASSICTLTRTTGISFGTQQNITNAQMVAY